MSGRLRTRFAPSPTGPLHLGHAFSALVGFDLAHKADGAFLLRIEDLDQSRARAEWEAQIFEDLTWLGLTWPRPVMRQSDRHAAYDAALDALWKMGLLYPCTCTRRDIREAASAPNEGTPPMGPDGIVYPGTCRPRGAPPSGERPCDTALRLNMSVAARQLSRLKGGPPPGFEERGVDAGHPTGSVAIEATDLVEGVGDVILARPGQGAAYHLAVVVDDAAQSITDVVRGADLFEATRIHVVLQRLLGLPTPVYHHHRLIRDAAGKRLAKRDDARALATLRRDGWSPADIRRAVGL